MSDAPRLTRRAVIGGAAAGALAGPTVARALASAADGRVFSRWIGPVGGAARTIVPGRPFVMAGVQWAGPPAARVELRTRRARDGAWGPWALASIRGHDGDGRAARAGGWFGEPLWMGDAEALQVRAVGSTATGVRVHFVAPRAGAAAQHDGVAAAADAMALAQPVLPAGPGQPPIIARSAWAGDHAPPAAGPFYGTVKLAFVHHTDNPNGYGAGDVPGMLLAMYDYHRYTRGYYDIAYNFIIDAFGRMWEARAGGIDEPVLGAHAGGFNGVSTGIAVLGTFMDVVPPAPAIEALEHLLAWKLSLHGIPVTGKVRVEVNPADAFYTPFRPGQRVLLPRVAGHRDGDLTDCPGNAFYARLPSIRPRVAALAGVPAQLTLVASAAVVSPGTSITLSGRLAQLGGPPIAGAAVLVQVVGGERTVAAATTDPNGTWSAVVLPAGNVLVRALHADAPAAVSDVLALGIRPSITLAPVPGSASRLAGTIVPHKARVTIDVYRLVRGRRRFVSTAGVRVHAGAFTVAPRLPGRGTFMIVARSPADTTTVAAASPPLRVSR